MIKVTMNFGNKKLFIINPNQIRTGLRKALYDSGKQLQSVARERIADKTTKTGRVYRIPRALKSGKNKGSIVYRTHQASAAGEYPANFTGNLKNSINFTVVGSSKLIFGARAFYAKWLDEGTSRMAARPYIIPTVQSEAETILRYINDAISTTLSRNKSR